MEYFENINNKTGSAGEYVHFILISFSGSASGFR